MSLEITDKDYLAAREEMKQGLRQVSDAGIDISSSTFQAVFKATVLKLYEEVLSDPRTYEI